MISSSLRAASSREIACRDALHCSTHYMALGLKQTSGRHYQTVRCYSLACADNNALTLVLVWEQHRVLRRAKKRPARRT